MIQQIVKWRCQKKTAITATLFVKQELRSSFNTGRWRGDAKDKTWAKLLKNKTFQKFELLDLP